MGDKVLDFSHRGWLYEESFLFYDYQTDSLWVQATGEAIHGTYKGTQLERLPATQTPWSQWRKLYPHTKVLSRPLDQTKKYWRDPYSRYYATGKGIRYQRYRPLHFGLAVVLANEQKLYPFRELEKVPVVNDRVGDKPVVIIFHAGSRTAVAFDRRHQNQELDFELMGRRDNDVILTDHQTKSTWSGLTGRCLAGPIQGIQLSQVTTTQFVVENWPLHYPHGAVYQAP